MRSLTTATPSVPPQLRRRRVASWRLPQLRSGLRDPWTELPGLVRDVHTTLATGADHGELLDLAVYLHVHVTNAWLILAAAPDDLRRRAVFLARRLAQERDEVTTLGMAGFAVAHTLLTGGAFELAKTELDSLTLPPITVKAQHRRQVARVLGRFYAKWAGTARAEQVFTRWPACVAVAITGIAARDYRQGELWPHLWAGLRPR